MGDDAGVVIEFDDLEFFNDDVLVHVHVNHLSFMKFTLYCVDIHNITQN